MVQSVSSGTLRYYEHFGPIASANPGPNSSSDNAYLSAVSILDQL